MWHQHIECCCRSADINKTCKNLCNRTLGVRQAQAQRAKAQRALSMGKPVDQPADAAQNDDACNDIQTRVDRRNPRYILWVDKKGCSHHDDERKPDRKPGRADDLADVSKADAFSRINPIAKRTTSQKREANRI